MKPIAFLTALLTISIIGNGLFYFQTTVQSDSLNLIPILKRELNIVSALLPESLNKGQIKEVFKTKGYKVVVGGEYYYANKPNTTLAINNVHSLLSR